MLYDFMHKMNKDHVAEALELFESGFNCSQSVFEVFSESSGLPRETALKIASPFGGGLGGYGRTCGALTGAMMVIGLIYGNSAVTDSDARERVRAKTRELIETFEKIHGTSTCNELLGFDRSHLSGAGLQAKQLFIHMTCPKFLETVVSFLEEEF
jgi:C_GCAxxG_C_C family probable redox protein